MHEETRALEFRALLSSCRARLRPEDVGLPTTIRRRVSGLRREEVAELVGVSPNWYALFENGSNARRFSPAFVQRVANALRLDERESALLFRLALPEIRVAVEQYERSANDGAIRSLRGMRSLIRRVTAATTFLEATAIAVEVVQEVIAPSSVAVAILVPDLESPRVIAAGPRASIDLEASGIADTCVLVNSPNLSGLTTFSEYRSSYRETLNGAFNFEQRTSDGHSFVVAVVCDSPVASETLGATALCPVDPNAGVAAPLSEATLNANEYWGWNSKLDVRSTITHGLFTNGRYCGNLCALWTTPRAMVSVDIEVLRTASAIVELAAAPSGVQGN